MPALEFKIDHMLTLVQKNLTILTEALYDLGYKRMTIDSVLEISSD
jgi:hypothetical protein